MSGVHALRDVRCGSVDRGVTKSVTEPKTALSYEVKKERVVLPSQTGKERVTQGVRPKGKACCNQCLTPCGQK